MAVPVYLGRVLHVIDPDNFWMHIGTDESFAQFMQFELNAEDYCRLTGNIIEDISQVFAGQHVFVDCTETGGSWRRGQVSRVDNIHRCADVVYKDYGSTELVEEARLYEMPEDYVQFPSQALPCKLAGIQPIARSWTSRAIKTFQQLTADTVFHTILISTGPNFRVVLYRQDEEGRSISHEMMSQELALPSGEPVTEFFADANDFYQQNTEDVNEDESSKWPVDAVSDQYCDTDEIIYVTDNTIEQTEEDDFPESPDTIPSFNFHQLHHTKEADTEKFHEKKARQTRKQLAKENEIIMRDVEEFANQAIFAGYGGLDDIGSANSYATTPQVPYVTEFIPEYQNTGSVQEYHPVDHTMDHSVDQSVDYGSIVVAHQETVQKIMSPQKEASPHMPLKRYSRMRARDKTSKPSPDRQELNNNNNKTNTRLTEQKEAMSRESVISCTSSYSDLSGNAVSVEPSFITPVIKAEGLSDLDRRLSSAPVEFSRRTKGRGRGRGSPRGSFSKADDKEKTSDGTASPQTCSSQETFENAEEDKPKFKLTGLLKNKASGETSQGEGGRKTLPDISSLLNKIFVEAEKESSQITRVKLREVIHTLSDLYIVPDREQLSDALFTILNRAVRYYGEFHDVMLEMVESLQGSAGFAECFLENIKKMEEMYIKIQTRGKPFHHQCSKLIGHLFNLSIHWECRSQVHDVVCAWMDKWILFNKKAQQIGQDLLQVIYLECFETVWDIAGATFSSLYPDRKALIQRECRDKILNIDVSRQVRSRMLDIFISKLIVPADAMRSSSETQTEVLKTFSKGTQTFDVQNTKVSNTVSKERAFRSSSQSSNKEEKEWPTLGAPKVPDWTMKILDTMKSGGNSQGKEPKLLGRAPEVLMTPNSFSDSSTADLSNNSSAAQLSSDSTSRSLSNNRHMYNKPTAAGEKNSASKLKSFRSSSPSAKVSPKQHSVKTDLHDTWSRDVSWRSSPSDRVSSNTMWPSFVPGKQSQENLSNSALALEKSKSAEVKAKDKSEILESYFPSAHSENRVSTEPNFTRDKTLQEIGAEWLSAVESTSAEEKSGSGNSKVKCGDSHVPKDKSSGTDVVKEKMFDWFDMEEEEEEESGSKPSCENDIVSKVSSDPSSVKKEVENEHISSAKENKAKSNDDEYDWFDLIPKENGPKMFETSETSRTPAASQSKKEEESRPAPKARDWFDIEDNNESDDTENDADWVTDSSDDEESSMQNTSGDVVALTHKYVIDTLNTDDSESSESVRTASSKEQRRWVPGKRKCTLCGEDNHVIHECPRKDKGFFL